MMASWQAAVMVAIFALATLFTRALPFLAFPASRPTPKFIVYLGRVLPFAITAMLVVYCLKDVHPGTWPHALPEVLAMAVVCGLFLWRKNSLLAIAAGTLLYMVLVQVVFV
ncbi:AzlD domain-containing protein [Ruminococcaceae bacterium OttesenSCG-928-O06]|nr:AzlD domain-containing protein [Ruminococcaceae bacterium OttesenSCG-928-O06]